MNESSNGKGFSVSLFVNNKPGVLVRIAQTFARRGYNIDSLVVSNAHDARFSRITVVFQGDHENVDQILRQLNKLIDVVKLVDLTEGDHIERELMLIKIKATGAQRAEVKRTCDIFRGQIVDVAPAMYTVQLTGASDKLDAFIEAIGTSAILEVVRSGVSGIARGERVLSL